MNVLFIGNLYENKQMSLFAENSKRGFQFASHYFQEAIIDGFLKNGINLNVLTIPTLSSFPFGCNLLKVPSCHYYYDGNMIGKSVGYWNLPFIKNSIRLFKQYIEKWYVSAGEEKYIIIYSLVSYHVKLAKYIREVYPDVKICLIVADLPEFMGCNKYYKMFGFQKRDILYINDNLHIFNGFILLSPHMSEKLSIGNARSITMEGIYNGKVTQTIHNNKSDNFVILYTGNLDKRYGITDLVDAVMLVKNAELRLVICGWGDSVSYIEQKSKIDERIIFKGTLQRDEILELQKSASLLVNPRHSSEEFTKYSFPSKTMEYMASGTPTLMCPLQCLPEEYKSYLYFFDDESIDGMASTIAKICELSRKDLEEKGHEASNFISCNKTSKPQMHRVINFLKSLDHSR